MIMGNGNCGIAAKPWYACVLLHVFSFGYALYLMLILFIFLFSHCLLSLSRWVFWILSACASTVELEFVAFLLISVIFFLKKNGIFGIISSRILKIKMEMGLE